MAKDESYNEFLKRFVYNGKDGLGTGRDSVPFEEDEDKEEALDALLNDDFDDEDFPDNDTPKAGGENEDLLSAIEDAFSIVDNADFPVAAVQVTREGDKYQIAVVFEA